jgi:nicotinamide-nucleotide adenylyltransferase
MAHGRFQPFHLGHSEYLALVAARARHVLVGITDGAVAEAADPRRHLLASNPYSFAEREAMVRAAAADVGIARDRLEVLSLDIARPDRWPERLRRGTVHYLRVFDAWGAEKYERLTTAGLDVRVLQPGARKSISGCEVRALLRDGRPVDHLVPVGVARLLG